MAVLHDNEEMLKEKTIEAAVKAVREDGAHAVIFGCTCMCTVQEAVAEGLKKQGIDIPVIEPYRAALYDAIACVLQGVSHSKYAYCLHFTISLVYLVHRGPYSVIFY